MPRFIKRRTGWAVADKLGVRQRALLCSAFLAVAFGSLVARLWYLQVVHGAMYLEQAKENRLRDVPLAAPRGLILDRNGVVLATSRVTHAISVVPAALPSAKREKAQRAALLQSLGSLLKISPQQIENEVAAARRKGGRLYDPVAIVDNAGLDTITIVEENKWRLGRAVLVTDEIKRFYPQAALAGHALGYTGTVDERELERNAEQLKENPSGRELKYRDIVGKAGIERFYDALLAGTEGSDQYEVDARARPVRRVRRIAEKPGATLVLTIDSRLQRAAIEALMRAKNSGAVVALDPRNGEVLALASRPMFDPNLFSLPRQEFNKIWPKLVADKRNPLINRATGALFPPGSTYKAVTASAVLQKRAVTPASSFVCTGGYQFGGRRFGCWTTHGRQEILGALAHSCDVYFYLSALRCGNAAGSGPQYLAKVSRDFGLDEKTGIDLPVESAGVVPDPAWRRRVNKDRPDLARWFPGSTLNMSIGQGDVLTTPLQMASVAAIVANGGTVWQPHLLREVRGEKTERTTPIARRHVAISARNMALVKQGMRQVVTGGTGQVVNLPQVAVAGKTGSAEVNHKLPHAWFICFAPYDRPRIAIAVLVENSGHGSEHAAPVARAVLEAAFPRPANIKPAAPQKVRGD